MGTCETCVHWGAPDERERGFEVRTCKAVEHDERGSNAYDPADWDWMKEDDPEGYAEIFRFSEALAVVVDGSGYHAALKCRATFGCVLHTDKPHAD